MPLQCGREGSYVEAHLFWLTGTPEYPSLNSAVVGGRTLRPKRFGLTWRGGGGPEVRDYPPVSNSLLGYTRLFFFDGVAVYGRICP